MIDLDSLRIVDCYQWLNCGRTAAKQLNCDQSTVSRSWKRAQWLFESASATEDLQYVDLERRVHQCWRFTKGRDLRVHMFSWTNGLVKPNLPDSWVSNPLAMSTTAAPALQLLGDRVIDALCAPYPMVFDVNPEKFALIPLYSSSLVLLAPSDCVLSRERNLSHLDVCSMTRLGTLDFVPVEASSCSAKVDGQLFSSVESCEGEPVHRYWGTTLTPLVRRDLEVVDYVLSAPYMEYLVVLREWQEHGATLSLLRAIGEGLAGPSTQQCDQKQLALHCLD